MDYAALAQQFGGSMAEQPQQPQQGPSWAADLSRKDQGEIKMKMYQEGRKRLADLQAQISDAGVTVRGLDDFGRLNRENSTGSLWQQMTPDIGLFRDSGSQSMSAITAGLVPKQREPGSGSTSDFDARQFLQALPSVDKPGDVNKSIRTNFMTGYQSALDKANAMKAHLDQYGNLMEFDSQWAQRKPSAQPTQQSAPAATNIPAAAINMLKMKPSLKADFDAKYGVGAADKALGGR